MVLHGIQSDTIDSGKNRGSNSSAADTKLSRRGLLRVMGAGVAGTALLGTAGTASSAGSIGIDSHWASFTVHIENQDDTTHISTLDVTHLSVPACRYSRPPCAAPSSIETVFTDLFKVAAGEQITVPKIRIPEPWAQFYIDTYTVELETRDGSSADVTGLAAKDAISAKNVAYNEYDFLVSNGETYVFQGTIGTDGEVALTVESTD